MLATKSCISELLLSLLLVTFSALGFLPLFAGDLISVEHRLCDTKTYCQRTTLDLKTFCLGAKGARITLGSSFLVEPSNAVFPSDTNISSEGKKIQNGPCTHRSLFFSIPYGIDGISCGSFFGSGHCWYR